MSKPWDTIDDRAMQLLINELIKEFNEYNKAKSKTLFWMVSAFIPVIALALLFATRIHFDIYNIFSIIMSNLEVGLLLLIFVGISARIKICAADEKDKKKDYKSIRAQVTDNLNNIWRYHYELSTCNEIVDVLKNEYKINISYKG